MSLTNTQYDLLMRRYEEQQKQDREEHEAHAAEVAARVPEAEAIDRQIASLSADAARALLTGAREPAGNHPAGSSDEIISSLKKQIQALTEKKKALILAAGFPADYLDMHYACKDCHDTGYIGNRRCHCFNQAALDIIYGQSGLSESLSGLTFDAFRTEIYSDTPDPKTGRSPRDLAVRAKEDALLFVRDKKAGKEGNLLISGNAGVGKTFLTNCIAEELMRSAVSVVYFTAYGLFEVLRARTFDHDAAAESDYESLFSCDVLIIDDLGTEMTNTFTVSRFFDILNERLLRKRSLILTTNLSLRDLNDRYSERSFSRIIQNFSLIRLTGDDLRLR